MSLIARRLPWSSVAKSSPAVAVWMSPAFPKVSLLSKLLSRRGLPQTTFVESTAPAFKADTVAVVVVCGTLLSAAGLTTLLLSGPRDIAKDRIEPDDFSFMCEGTDGVICSCSSSARQRQWRGKLLQLLKENKTGSRETAVDAWMHKVKTRCALASYCFDPHFVDQQLQLVSLPEADVRALDVNIFFEREEEQRRTRLSRKALDDKHDSRVVGLKMSNLLQAPTLHIPSREKAVVLQHLLAVELSPGCALQEVEGMPSRSTLQAVAALRASGWQVSPLLDEPRELYSGDCKRVAKVLRSRIDVSKVDRSAWPNGSLRVFMDGQPVFPTTMSGNHTADTSAELKATLSNFALSSPESLATSIAAALSGLNRKVLLDLQKLQCFAAGESEKIAQQLLEVLRTPGNEDALGDLTTSQSMKAAIKSASKSSRGTCKACMQAHERSGSRLISSRSNAIAIQQWLSLFLLGRAAIDAKVLVNFISIDKDLQSDPAVEKQLRTLRYTPLKELLPDQKWSAGVWTSVTVTGFDAIPHQSTITAHASELQDLVQQYSEATASKA